MEEEIQGNDERVVRERIRNCILNILRQVDVNHAERLGNVCFRLEWLLSIVIRYHQTNLVERHVVDLLRESLRCLSSINGPEEHEVEPTVIFTGHRGRLMREIPRLQLNFLTERRFTARQMATILGASARTIQRRLQQFGLSIRQTYTNMRDQELDLAVQEILRTQPNTGYKRMTGYLAACGVRVQQQRIRESMRRVDPEGTLIRALELNTINRRCYSVPSPLALWHIDGHHKLIRYQIVFHYISTVHGVFGDYAKPI